MLTATPRYSNEFYITKRVLEHIQSQLPGETLHTHIDVPHDRIARDTTNSAILRAHLTPVNVEERSPCKVKVGPNGEVIYSIGSTRYSLTLVLWTSYTRVAQALEGVMLNAFRDLPRYSFKLLTIPELWDMPVRVDHMQRVGVYDDNNMPGLEENTQVIVRGNLHVDSVFVATNVSNDASGTVSTTPSANGGFDGNLPAPITDVQLVITPNT